MKSAFALVFLLCISAGYGLKCYKCTSTKSWDDCAAVKIEKTCSSGEDLCSKAYFNGKSEGVSVEGFDKECLSAADCDGFEKTDFCKGKECKINCCSGDLCNAAALPMVSAFIFIACALVAFAF
ncbi:u-PAR/Ly-6 domain [Desmophyllum pertusum]|uniref:U-PAR/Ly-6 domain n=1 Tax=Desmophyllum pertusum TaxID=174260 RepID=A0A9W9Z6B6_9CNID|nr:u-PAR/Ly-6 domain [Desmophyllum pertusum]